ncbi:S8 family serine peptidase [Pontibacter chitinilyticus]|uniref:S8 family serine peptidase n=1 Tax=Pontibacter chitinilyticus TaxID=2674989 RepID=UPI0032196DAC
MKIVLHVLGSIFFIAVFASCKENNAGPIRNVRFDPDLLNKMQVAGSSCTTYSYNDRGNTVNLGAVYTGQVLVAFKPNLPAAVQERVLAKYGFVKGVSAPVATSSLQLHAVQLQEGLNCKQVEQALKELAADVQFAYVAPYFITGSQGGEQLQGLSNEVLVTTTEGGLATLNKLAKNYKAEVLQQLRNNTYLVKVDKQSNGNALDMANFLQGQPGIAQAEPDFIISLVAETVFRPLQAGSGERITGR